MAISSKAGRPAPKPDRVGRYEVLDHLGSGAFAAVYLAADPSLDAVVAIKVLGDHHASSYEIRERFVREAQLLRRMRSDRVVAIYDIDEHEGQPFLVMEAINGGTLADRLDAAGHESSAVARLVSELAACLRAIHDAALVHRDIKPTNLLIRSAPDSIRDASEPDPPPLLGADEQLVLADFGLCRSIDDTSLTVGGGTLGYLAPEQRGPGTAVDARADLYAATVIVAEALLGPNFDVNAVRSQPIAAVLERGRALDPDDRYDDVDHWERAWLAALGGVDDHPVTDASTRGSPPDSPLRPFRLSAAGVLLALVAAIALTTIIVFVVTDNRAPDPPAPEAPIERPDADANSGPQVIGPDELLVGETGTYVHEGRVGATYEWRTPGGVTTTDDQITVTPSGPGDLTIRLTEDDQGTVRTTTWTIRVRTR